MIHVTVYWWHKDSQCRDYARHCVPNHGQFDCLFNSLLRQTLNKSSKLMLLDLFGGKPTVTGGFPSQRASNAEIVSMSWRRFTSSAFCTMSTSLNHKSWRLEISCHVRFWVPKQSWNRFDLNNASHYFLLADTSPVDLTVGQYLTGLVVCTI